MLRQDRLSILEQTESRLELAAHGTNRRRLLETRRQFYCVWCKTAGAAQHTWFSVEDTNNRIIHAIRNPAIVNKRVRRDRGKPLTRLGIVDDLRLFGDVAACHDPRRVHVL